MTKSPYELMRDERDCLQADLDRARGALEKIAAYRCELPMRKQTCLERDDAHLCRTCIARQALNEIERERCPRCAGATAVADALCWRCKAIRQPTEGRK